MDDPTVNWSKERYDEIESKMVPFLRSSGYNVKKDVQFLPISDPKGPFRRPIIDKFKDMGTVIMGRLNLVPCVRVIPYWSCQTRLK
ncbi:hypothetical protein SLA2020_176910 [Shorea laevis]